MNELADSSASLYYLFSAHYINLHNVCFKYCTFNHHFVFDDDVLWSLSWWWSSFVLILVTCERVSPLISTFSTLLESDLHMWCLWTQTMALLQPKAQDDVLSLNRDSVEGFIRVWSVFKTTQSHNKRAANGETHVNNESWSQISTNVLLHTSYWLVSFTRLFVWVCEDNIFKHL